MPGKAVKRTKHIPQRTCVSCRTVMPKRTLIRIVRGPERVEVDPTGKLPGRGAYLHNSHSCWEKGLKGVLGHALKTELTQDDLAGLRRYMATLPDSQEETGKGV